MTSSPVAPHTTFPSGYPFRHGPWAIAYGPGNEALQVAQVLRDQCTQRGFDGPSLPTERTARLPLDRFTSVIVVAPSEGMDCNADALLQPSNDLADGYRARRPDGIRAVREGRVEPYNAGVLQFVATREVLEHPSSRLLLGKVDNHLELATPARDPDAIFAIYDDVEIPGMPTITPIGLADRETRQLWAKLQEWGLRTVDDVQPVLDRMEELRAYYNYDARNGLRRPLGGDVPRSRYDFLLDPPHEHPRSADFSNWEPDGATVARDVIVELARVVPTVVNPRPTRGSNKRFGRFYGDLKLLGLYLKFTPNAEQIDFLNE